MLLRNSSALNPFFRPALKPFSLQETYAIKRIEFDPTYIPPKEFTRARKLYDAKQLELKMLRQSRSNLFYIGIKHGLPLFVGVVLFGAVFYVINARHKREGLTKEIRIKLKDSSWIQEVMAED